MFQFLKKLMASPLTPAEVRITQTLQAGHTLTVRWECGGDEGFVYTEIDGQEIETNYNDENDLAYLLDQYLTEKLNLPSAGEFSMEGTGHIFRDGQEVVIDYKSVANTYLDENWKDEFTDEELLAMGVELPETPATDDQPRPSESTNETVETTDDDYDPIMSDEYSGRKVLFRLN